MTRQVSPVYKVPTPRQSSADMNLQQSVDSTEAAWCWFGTDFPDDDNEPRVELFAMRFKTMQLAYECKAKFEECRSASEHRNSGRDTKDVELKLPASSDDHMEKCTGVTGVPLPPSFNNALRCPCCVACQLTVALTAGARPTAHDVNNNCEATGAGGCHATGTPVTGHQQSLSDSAQFYETATVDKYTVIFSNANKTVKVVSDHSSAGARLLVLSDTGAVELSHVISARDLITRWSPDTCGVWMEEAGDLKAVYVKAVDITFGSTAAAQEFIEVFRRCAKNAASS